MRVLGGMSIRRPENRRREEPSFSFSTSSLSGLQLSNTTVYEPYIRAPHGTDEPSCRHPISCGLRINISGMFWFISGVALCYSDATGEIR